MTSTQTLRETAAAIVGGKRPDRTKLVALAQSWLVQNPEKKPLPDNITFRQLEIFYYIHETVATQQTSPTVREIGGRFGIRSPNGVMCHLRALEKKGLIQRTEHTSRGIRVVDSYR